MAFENLYGNIDFQAQNKMAMAQQQQFAQMLGQGIQAAQQKRAQDLQERQMEAKAKEVDLDKMAQVEVLKMKQGLPYDANIIAAYSDFKGSQTYIDPVTQQVVTNPALMDRLGMGGNQRIVNRTQGIVPEVGASAIPVPMYESQLNQMMGQPAPMPPPETRLSVDDLQGIPPIDMADLGNANIPYNPPQNVISADDFDTYKAGGILKGTPAGAKAEEESRQKAQDAFVAEKMKRSIQGLERFDQSQLASANYANRMAETSQIINDLEGKHGGAKTGIAGGVEAVISAIPSMGITDKLGKGIVKIAATPEEQQYLNAAQNWIRANLRKESGAVIGDQEMIDEYATYFPTAGDSQKVIEQKRQLRKETEKGMIAQSAGAYQEAFGKKAQEINQGGWSIKAK